MSKIRDGVAVVIPVHNGADALDKVLPAWGTVLTNTTRPFEIIVVNDGSTDNTGEVLQKRAGSVPHLRVLTNPTREGFGACLRKALNETKQPLLLYTGVDYPYTPGDIHQMLVRIELRDEVFGKQPDLISGARVGQYPPTWVKYLSYSWKLFWRVFAGLPMVDSQPWYGWDEWWYRFRAHWVFGVPLADVNSAFKLWRVSFLKRFPIQSDGDFVHVELVAKATFLTSIMDEVPLTPRAEPFPPLGDVSADRRKVFSDPQFTFTAAAPPSPPVPEAALPTPALPATNPATVVIPEAKSPAPGSPAPDVAKTVTPTPVEAAQPTKAEAAQPAKSDAIPATSKIEPASEQPKPPVAPTPAAPSPSVATPAAPPSTPDAAKPSLPTPSATPADSPPTESVKPEAPMPADPTKSAAQPSPDKPAETNAGGPSSPGSPVPAT